MFKNAGGGWQLFFLRLTGKELIIKMRMNMPYLISRSCRWGIWRSTARHKTVRCDYELNSFQQLQGIVHPKNNQWLVTFLLFQTSCLLLCLFLFIYLFFWGGGGGTFKTSVLTTMAVHSDEHQKGPENTTKFHLTHNSQFSMLLGAVLTVVHEFTKTTKNTFVSWNKIKSRY